MREFPVGEAFYFYGEAPAKKKTGVYVQRSKSVFYHGHFPLKTIDIENVLMYSTSKKL